MTAGGAFHSAPSGATCPSVTSPRSPRTSSQREGLLPARRLPGGQTGPSALAPEDSAHETAAATSNRRATRDAIGALVYPVLAVADHERSGVAQCADIAETQPEAHADLADHSQRRSQGWRQPRQRQKG